MLQSYAMPLLLALACGCGRQPETDGAAGPPALEPPAPAPAPVAPQEPARQPHAPAYKLSIHASKYELGPTGSEVFFLKGNEVHAADDKTGKSRQVVKDAGDTHCLAFRSPNRLLTGGKLIRLWELDKPDAPPADIDPLAHDGPAVVQMLSVPVNALKEKAPHRDVFAVSDRLGFTRGDFLLFDLAKEDGVTGGRTRFGTGGLALSPDGERFARGGLDWKVVCYRTGANAPSWTAEHDRDVVWLAFSPDGAMLAACGRKAVTVYDARTGGRLSRHEGCGGESVAFLDDTGWYAATSADRMVVQHVRLGGKLTLEPGGHLAVSTDGKHVAARIGKEGLGIWRTEELIKAASATAAKQ